MQFEADQFPAGKDAFAGAGESLLSEGIQSIEVFFVHERYQGSGARKVVL